MTAATIEIESPLSGLSAEQIDALARRVRRDPRPGPRRPRRARPPLHREHDRDAPPPRGDLAGAAARLQQPARPGRRHRGALGGEDPREHGDRPQRPARAVGLDERPAASTPRPGTGTPPRPRRPGSTPTTTSTTPSPTSAARTRTSATRSCGSTRSRSGTRSTSSSRFYNLLLMAFFEWGVALHDMDYEAIRKGEKSKAEVKRQLKGIVGKAKSQIVKDYIAWPLLSGLATAAVELALETVADRREPGRRRRRGGLAGSLRRALEQGRQGGPLDGEGERDRQRGPQRLGLRDHLLRPLSRPDLHLQPGRGRGREPGRLVRAPALGLGEHRGRPASSTSPAATSASRSSTTSSRTCPAPATPRSRRR